MSILQTCCHDILRSQMQQVVSALVYMTAQKMFWQHVRPLTYRYTSKSTKSIPVTDGYDTVITKGDRYLFNAPVGSKEVMS